MDTIEITIINWDKYNKRKDLKHPWWFAMSNSFFQDPDFFDFSAEEKLAWIMILAEASRAKKAQVRININYAEKVCGIKQKSLESAISKLNHLGCLKHERMPNGLRTDADQHITIQNNTEQNKNTPLSVSTDSRGRREVGEKWNAEIKACPKFRGWPKTRDDAAKRFLEHHTIADWLEVIKKINESDFLSGKEKKFRATIDWALKPANTAKILEDNYENRSGGSSDNHTTKPSEESAIRVLEGIKKFSSHESEKLRAFLGEELFRRACKVPGGIAGIRSAPSGPFVVKNLASALKEVKL